MSYTENYYITLTPQSSDYLSLTFKENKYDVKDRNLEGYPKMFLYECTTYPLCELKNEDEVFII